jgi:hypothetical protein
MASEDLTTFDGFTRAFLTPELTTTFEVTAEQVDRPWIVVKYGNTTVALNLMPLTDHLCIDVFPFVKGERGRAGVFGMEDGRRVELADHKCQGTVYGWPATRLVSVIASEYDTIPRP